MSELSDTIAEVAAGPKAQVVDGQSTTEHSIGDLIDAEQHVAENTAKNKTKLPIRMLQIRPGGSI